MPREEDDATQGGGLRRGARVAGLGLGGGPAGGGRPALPAGGVLSAWQGAGGPGPGPLGGWLCGTTRLPLGRARAFPGPGRGVPGPGRGLPGLWRALLGFFLRRQNYHMDGILSLWEGWNPCGRPIPLASPTCSGTTQGPLAAGRRHSWPSRRHRAGQALQFSFFRRRLPSCACASTPASACKAGPSAWPWRSSPPLAHRADRALLLLRGRPALQPVPDGRHRVPGVPALRGPGCPGPAGPGPAAADQRQVHRRGLRHPPDARLLALPLAPPPESPPALRQGGPGRAGPGLQPLRAQHGQLPEPGLSHALQERGHLPGSARPHGPRPGDQASLEPFRHDFL